MMKAMIGRPRQGSPRAIVHRNENQHFPDSRMQTERTMREGAMITDSSSYAAHPCERIRGKEERPTWQWIEDQSNNSSHMN
jgi:hypothetical protein